MKRGAKISTFKLKNIKEQIVSVNTFDIADYIISLHQNYQKKLSLCKLQTIIFFYEVLSKTTHTVPFVDDFFVLKKNNINLNDLDWKYRKIKNENIAAEITYKIKPATFSKKGSSAKFLTALTQYFENYSNRQLKKLIRKTPIYQKFNIQTNKENKAIKKKETIIKMEKKDFEKYYPLKKWEDVYNMILDIDDKMTLFKL